MHRYFCVLIIALHAVNLLCQSPPRGDDDSSSKLLQKLDEILERGNENAALFKKQLSEQSVEIQKFQDVKKFLEQMTEQNLKLSDTIQKLQAQQYKTIDRNAHNVRLLVESVGLKLESMLISAVKNNDISQVHLLLELGVSIEYQDSQGNRPIHLAVLNRHVRVLKILLDNKVDIESGGQYQKTALHIAGYNDCLECAELLISNGARLNSRDDSLNTPIIHAARIGFNDYVELLLMKGANVNAVQITGMTALHWATMDGQLSTVKLLVKNGADVRWKSRDGKTALDLAVANHHTSLVEFLQNLNVT